MKSYKIIALILALIFCVSPLASCTGGDSEVTTGGGAESLIPEDTASETNPADKFLSDGEPVYTIVRPLEPTALESGLSKKLRADFLSLTNVTFEAVTDYDGKKDNSARPEILIGKTNRAESIKAEEEVAKNGGYVMREDGNKIVIFGADDATLAKAYSEFERVYFGEERATLVGDYAPDKAVPAGYEKVSEKTEELLTVKDNFDYTEAYKVNFVGATDAPAYMGEIKTGLIVSEYDTLYDVVAELNVLSFGAKGDGKTDDTEAFKAALKAADQKGGCVVYVPKGHYCLTDSLTVGDNVSIVGEIKPGTAEGTVLCIYGGKGSTDPTKSAFIMGPSASLQNLAIWYPEQTFVNGEPIPYPATVKQEWIDGVTVRNVTFVNSYYGFDYTGTGIYALQYTRDIYGTFLHLGYRNDRSLDIGKLENFHFSPDYWLESGLPGVPDAELLKTYMIRNSTGIIIERIDWTYISDIYIEGYNIGLHARRSKAADEYDGVTNGQLYNLNVTDSYTGILMEDAAWLLMTGCKFSAVGNSGASALRFLSSCGSGPENQPGDICFVDSTLESAGANAVINCCNSAVTYTSCKLSSNGGNVIANMTAAAQRILNSEVSGNSVGIELLKDDTLPTTPEVDYTHDVVTKPKSDKYINITEAPYNAKANEDITAVLQKALDDLKATGGTVYIPSGIFYISAGIDVWAGIELRGSVIAPGYAHRTGTGTRLYTNFGKNDPDGEALIDLYEGAGLRGLGIIYHEQKTSSLTPYSYSIRGKGSNVYVVDVSTSTSYNGIDLASYKCDNHYVEFVWGVGLNNAITVGSGSENGIIRDCHFTPNCWFDQSDPNAWNNVYQYMMDNSTTFLIGESKNEILYNNFTICIKTGIEITDGAQNVQLLGNGVDSSDTAVLLSGNCTAYFVNSQLVNLRDSGGKAQYFDIVRTSEDFTGSVDFFNSSSWGTTNYVYNLNGLGTVRVIGGRIGRCDGKLANIAGGEVYFYSCSNDTSAIISAVDSVKKIYLSGNLFTSNFINSLKKIKQACGPDVE
ncbi:MAG: hypothetical protein J6S71_04115 [Clostridia bacterium]|nr:hypothetical protein [Clostridia bacterium]